jgi:hypothetical protein
VEHSNLGVRRLLRKLRFPELLERDPYAAMLRHASTNGTSARDALVALLDEVLHRYPPVYRTIIERIDVDGAQAKAIAGELYLSYRTLHRYRTVAVAAIAEALERRFGAARLSAAAAGDRNADARALVSEGFEHLRRSSLRSFDTASRCFSRALELDERCADAWIGLAICHENQAAHSERDAAASSAAAVRARERAAHLTEARDTTAGSGGATPRGYSPATMVAASASSAAASAR